MRNAVDLGRVFSRYAYLVLNGEWHTDRRGRRWWKRQTPETRERRVRERYSFYVRSPR